MKTIVFYLIYFSIGFALGFFFNDLIREKKVQVIVDDSKIQQFIKQREDSLRKIYDAKFDSIQKSKTVFITEVKMIYKNIQRENSIISGFYNPDSLRKVAIEYVENQ